MKKVPIIFNQIRLFSFSIYWRKVEFLIINIPSNKPKAWGHFAPNLESAYKILGV